MGAGSLRAWLRRLAPTARVAVRAAGAVGWVRERGGGALRAVWRD